MPNRKLIFITLLTVILTTLPLPGASTQVNSLNTIAFAQSEGPGGTDWIIPGVERQDAEVLANRLSIAPEEAAEMLARQPAIANLREQLAERTNGNFAGLWVTGTSPATQRVIVAFKEDVDEEVADLRADFLYPELLQGVTVERSYDELWKIYQNTIAQRNGLPEADARRIDVILDEQANEVHVYAPADLVDAVEGVVADDPAVRVFEAIQESMHDATTLRGGVSLSTCTAGFVVTSGANRGLTTAGHCSDSQSYGGTNVGSVVNQQEGWNVDLQVHKLGSNWAPRNEIEILTAIRVSTLDSMSACMA